MINAAGIFLIKKDNTLLVGHPTHHKASFWSIPKGRVDDGENFREAAIRETFEETNVDVSDWKVIHKLPPVKYKKTNKTLHGFVIFESENDFDFDSFEIKCNSNVPEEDGGFPEMDAFKWVTLDEAGKCLHESQVACLPLIQNIIDEKNKKSNGTENKKRAS